MVSMKQFGVVLGLTCLKARWPRGKQVITSKEAKDQLRATSFVLAQMAQVNDPRSKVSKESLKWATFCAKISDDKETDDTNTEELQVLLESDDRIDNLDQTSTLKPEDILS